MDKLGPGDAGLDDESLLLSAQASHEALNMLLFTRWAARGTSAASKLIQYPSSDSHEPSPTPRPVPKKKKRYPVTINIQDCKYDIGMTRMVSSPTLMLWHGQCATAAKRQSSAFARSPAIRGSSTGSIRVYQWSGSWP